MAPFVERTLDELDPAARVIIAFDTSDVIDVVEPQPIFEALLDEHRALRWEGGVAFFGMEDILAAGRNPNISSDIEPAYAGMGSRNALIPLHSHGSSHTAYRKLLDPLLAPKALAYLEPHIRDLADSLIDVFVDRGRVEFHDEFAVPIAATIFLQLFGLPVTDMEFLNSTKDEILKNGGDTPEARAKLSVEAGDRLRAYLNDKLDERALESEPRDDLIGRFTTFAVDGRSLDRDEILRIMHLFTIAGLDTVTASLTCIVGWFARHRQELERVVVHPDVLPAAIEELMRYENPVLTSGGRMATADTDVNGVPVKAGDLVTQCWTTANLDPEVFPDPLTVDFDRSGNRHIAFAAGWHRCLGSHLARLELRTAIDQLHRRIPSYTITPGETPQYHHAGVRAATYLPLSFPA
jgi:cytochrome P450